MIFAWAQKKPGFFLFSTLQLIDCVANEQIMSKQYKPIV